MDKKILPDAKSVELADRKTKGFLIAFFCIIVSYLIYHITARACPDEDNNQKLIYYLLKENQSLTTELKVQKGINQSTPNITDSLLKQKINTDDK